MDSKQTAKKQLSGEGFLVVSYHRDLTSYIEQWEQKFWVVASLVVSVVGAFVSVGVPLILQLPFLPFTHSLILDTSLVLALGLLRYYNRPIWVKIPLCECEPSLLCPKMQKAIERTRPPFTYRQRFVLRLYKPVTRKVFSESLVVHADAEDFMILVRQDLSFWALL